MRCTRPRDVGFQPDGKTIAWSPRKISKEFATFQLPCGKCIACRLEYARTWAVRCVHEAEMHENNIFLTLTYSDEHLKSDKLIYKDFQDFMKALRHSVNSDQKIGYFVTGEYGDEKKRPHWHAIIFNYRPTDQTTLRTHFSGDQIYHSATLNKLWGKGNIEYGPVNLQTAGYCARYAAKKLIHGKDQSHDFNPISKKSSHHAIGKKYVEKHYKSIFNLGFIIIDGERLNIPRYYEKWLQKHQPSEWAKYVTNKKIHNQKLAKERNDKENDIEKKTNHERANLRGLRYTPVPTKHFVKETILNQKFKQLQKFLKL